MHARRLADPHLLRESRLRCVTSLTRRVDLGLQLIRKLRLRLQLLTKPTNLSGALSALLLRRE